MTDAANTPNSLCLLVVSFGTCRFGSCSHVINVPALGSTLPSIRFSSWSCMISTRPKCRSLCSLGKLPLAMSLVGCAAISMKHIQTIHKCSMIEIPDAAAQISVHTMVASIRIVGRPRSLGVRAVVLTNISCTIASNAYFSLYPF